MSRSIARLEHSYKVATNLERDRSRVERGRQRFKVLSFGDGYSPATFTARGSEDAPDSDPLASSSLAGARSGCRDGSLDWPRPASPWDDAAGCSECHFEMGNVRGQRIWVGCRGD